MRYKEYLTEEAELLLVAYGTAGRICFSAMREIRKKGIKVGLFQPQTLWPFPEERLNMLSRQAKGICVVEMSAGQMLHDVERIANPYTKTHFYGCMGGVIPMVEDVVSQTLTFYDGIRHSH